MIGMVVLKIICYSMRESFLLEEIVDHCEWIEEKNVFLTKWMYCIV